MKSEDDSDPVSFDWDQDEDTVILKLPLPENADNNDVSVNVTETVCTVSLKEKKIWNIKLFEAVDPSSPNNFVIKNQEVVIQVAKRINNKEWPSLQKSSETGNKIGEEVTGSNSLSDQEEDGVLKECHIDHIKNDIIERDNRSLHLHLYLTKLIKDSVKVTFNSDRIGVVFKTRDSNFLNHYRDCNSETLFLWDVILKGTVIPEQCKYTIKTSVIDIFFFKLKSERWGALHKPQSKQGKSSSLHGTISGSGERGNWMPLIKPSRKNNEKPKPTCAVPPLSHGQQSPSKESTVKPLHPSGFTGLDNLGNTCFMNSVLQVLANTRELKDYILANHLSEEINSENPLGTGGRLVLSFAILMRILWSGKHKSYAPSKFKTVIASKAIQFLGFAQHDAQEFMAYLLDGLHEDLNRVKNKPYTTAVDMDGRPDEEIAEESWKRHRRRNDSFIVDLFLGQYKSKLVCPVCNKVSITFDPFMQLSVPLPRKKRQLPVYFWSKEVYTKPIRMKIAVDMDGDIKELKDAMASHIRVESKNLRVFEVFKGRVYKHFSNEDPLNAIEANDIIFVSEVMSSKLAGEEVYECLVFQRKMYPSAVNRCSFCHTENNGVLKRCTQCKKAAYCNQECQKKHWSSHKYNCRLVPEVVGMPFFISLPASHATYTRLCQTMESVARYSTDMFQPPVSSSPSPISSPSSNQTNEYPLPHQSRVSIGKRDSAGSSGDASDDEGSSDCSMESADAELAAEMIVKSSPRPSSDEEAEEEAPTSPLGAVGGEDNSNKTVNKNRAKAKEDGSEGIATASVIGQPQITGRKQPLFFIKPCDRDGIGRRGSTGDRIGDQGDSLLDLSKTPFLAMDWRNDPKQVDHVLVESKPLDFVDDQSESSSNSEKVTTLENCLQLYTEAEKLSPNEAWYCPSCKENREASKQLSLWRLPPILIIQLKRFSFKNLIWRDKLDKMVEFPQRALDLSEFCQTGKNTPIYDLYGVINHHGGILGGHYTAYARLVSKETWKKNELDWRLLDDSHVSRVSEDAVVTRSAYLLFYRQRKPYVTYIPRVLPKPEVEEVNDDVPSQSGRRKRPDGPSGVSQPPVRSTGEDNRQQEEEEDVDASEAEEDDDDEIGCDKEGQMKYTNIDEID